MKRPGRRTREAKTTTLDERQPCLEDEEAYGVWANKSQLWSLVPAEAREAYLSGEKKDTVPVIDLLPLGYSKLLGKGRLPEVPIVVRARWVSKLAEKKITEAGGVVELVA